MQRDTEKKLAWAVILFLVGMGSGAIALTYGPRALILGTSCLVMGALVFALTWGILSLIERWVNWEG